MVRQAHHERIKFFSPVRPDASPSSAVNACSGHRGLF